MLISAITDAAAVVTSNLVECFAKGPSPFAESRTNRYRALMAEIYYSFDNAVI
jgi:hypothetical protein